MQNQFLELSEVLYLGRNRSRQTVADETQRAQLREVPNLRRYVAAEVVPRQIEVPQRVLEFPQLRRDSGFFEPITEAVGDWIREVVETELQGLQAWEISEFSGYHARDQVLIDLQRDESGQLRQRGRNFPSELSTAVARIQCKGGHPPRVATDSCDPVPLRQAQGPAPVEPPADVAVALDCLPHTPEHLAVCHELGVVGVVSDDRPELAKRGVVRDLVVREGGDSGGVAGTAPTHHRVCARYVAHHDGVARHHG